MRLSVITPCYNDFANLTSTLASFRDELNADDEFLLIDSSSDQGEARRIVENASLRCACRCFWISAAGVYSAQNRGILESGGEWIQIVNAGDHLRPGARLEIEKAIGAFPNITIHVFCQMAMGSKGPSYVFTPTARSVWPHQSLVVHRSVYQEEGQYLEKYRFGADQMFFAKVRKSQPWKLHPFVLTDYLLGGISSRLSFRHLGEIYAVRRALGQSLLPCIICSFTLPVLRRGLEKIFGIALISSMKSRLFPYYRFIRRSRDG